MTRLRALSFPRRSSKTDSMWTPLGFPSPYAHSRDSSGASSSSMSTPITPTFSSRGHGRWPSSSSSLVTTPDSPSNAPKSALHDLLEDPSECEDDHEDDSMSDAADRSRQDEPFCICDTTFCEHRRTSSHYRYSRTQYPPTPEHEWTAADDSFFEALVPEPSIKRRTPDTGEPNLAENLTRRLSRRFPSISKRWRDSNTPSPAAATSVMQSAPVSRSSSLRRPAARPSFMGQTEPTPSPTASYFGDNASEENLVLRPRASSKVLPLILDTAFQEVPEEPVDRQANSSTPLLPPLMSSHQGDESPKELTSPLEAPAIADPISSRGTPISSPVIPGYVTPPLSAKTSNASIHAARPGTVLYASADATAAQSSDHPDPWADKLGHANFHIYPEPYMPASCDYATCKRLLEDWETARREYMRQAVRTGEHHGPTSHIYKLTEQKWAEIDARWRSYHDRANAMAQASGEQTNSQTLAHTQPLAELPSLNDPRQPAKFPRIDEADVVGPMVKYAEIQHRPSRRKRSLLRVFTDPTALLARRATIAGLKTTPINFPSPVYTTTHDMTTQKAPAPGVGVETSLLRT